MAYGPGNARIFVALHGITVVFCGLTMLVLWEFMDIRRARVESRRIKHLSVASIVMYWITSIIIFMYFILMEYHVDIGGEMGFHIFQTFWGVFWRMGQALLYSLCIERLRHSFRNTKYQSSPRTFILLYVVIFIYVFGYLVKVILFSFFHATGRTNTRLYAFVGNIEEGITQVLDFTLSIGIIVLFMRKLHALNVDLADHQTLLSVTGTGMGMGSGSGSGSKRTTKSKTTNQNQSDYQLFSDSNEFPSSILTLRSTTSKTPNTNYNALMKRKWSLNQQQKSIINVMAKITLLSAVALASSQIVFVLSGMLYFTFLVDRYAECQDIVTSLKLGYLAVNTVVVSTSIVLGFDFSYDWYKKACCIDSICRKCCVKSTKWRMGKSTAARDHVWLSSDRDASINKE